jgi:UDP-N-acetylmuramoyl-tripeptide--D-alanyl-D-alanine ligase
MKGSAGDVNTRTTSYGPATGSAFGSLPAVLLGTPFRAVAIDSREVEPGDLFVALPGDHTDGHRFVGMALERGARAALVREDWLRDAALPAGVAVADADATALPAPAVVAVADPLATLQAFAAHHRMEIDVPVIGITGSVGKTSTKELVAAVLSQHLRTLSSVKSFNNEIGVPLTLLRLAPEHQAAVIEMGTYGVGEIAMLCRMARPRYGIVTNVGVSHLERMRTREVVARAKRELVEALPPEGLAILNGDDHRVRAMREHTAARTVFYGIEPGNDVWADAIETHGLGGLSFTVHGLGEPRRTRVPLIGQHNVYTVLATLIVARDLHVPWEAIERGLNNAEAQPRLIVRAGRDGATVLDDSYNASPTSCAAALAVLAEMPGRRIAVFGDMAELGPEEEEGHRAVGIAAAPVVDLLVVVGQKARMIGQAAETAGERPIEVLYADTNDQASALLQARIGADDYILVKGARVAATEQIVAALAGEGRA